MALPRRDRECEDAVQPMRRHRIRGDSKCPTGPGPCPRCGAVTAKRFNLKKRQVYWGCPYYPMCNGSRHS